MSEVKPDGDNQSVATSTEQATVVNGAVTGQAQLSADQESSPADNNIAVKLSITAPTSNSIDNNVDNKVK